MSKHELSFNSTTVSLSDAIPPRPERRSEERSLTVLRIAKLITEGGEELCRIRNISAGGIRAETCVAHEVGAQVVIELRADQRLAGSVVWSTEASVGVVFDESIDVARVLAKDAGDERRYAHQPRIQAPCIARIRMGTAAYKVPVTDISQGGMKVEIDVPGCVGAPVVVSVDGLPSAEGVIRWFRDGQAGIAFKVQFPFDQLTRWLGMRLAGRRATASKVRSANA